MNWTPKADVQWRVEFRRSVGQLAFEDFAASVDAADDRPIGGNPELRPTQTWTASLSHDRRHGKNALTARLWTDWRDDVLAYVPLPLGGQGLANLDGARVWGASAKLTHPIYYLLRGAQIAVEGEYMHSRVRDPITGRKQTIQDEEPGSLSIDFRHDIQSWKSAWGVSYAATKSRRDYYVDEISDERTSAIWTAFIETTAFADMKTKLELYGIGDTPTSITRRFYAPDRSGAFAGSETRKQSAGGAYLILTFNKQF